MKQVYSYPNAVYGYNNFVGTEKDSIYKAEGFSVNREINQLTAGTMGTTVASGMLLFTELLQTFLV